MYSGRPYTYHTSLQSSFILRILSIRKAAAMITLYIIAGGYTVIAITAPTALIAISIQSRSCRLSAFVILILPEGLDFFNIQNYNYDRKSYTFQIL